MSPEGVIRRLTRGKAVNCIYRRGELTGLISAWRLEETYILTWEECPDGEQHDESTYTRDDSYEFSSVEDMMAFIEANRFSAADFTP